jgi:hypothetical protein
MSKKQQEKENTEEKTFNPNNFMGEMNGVSFEEFDPMEQIPMFRVGEELPKGKTLSGRLDHIKRVASHKFAKSREKDDQGRGVEYIAVFERDGQKFGLWTTKPMRIALERVLEERGAGTPIAITYNGKITNADGNSQHDFAYKIGGNQ